MACRGAVRARHPLACLLPLALCDSQVRGRSVEVGFGVVGGGWLEQKRPLSTAPMPRRPQGGRGAPGAEDNGTTHHRL